MPIISKEQYIEAYIIACKVYNKSISAQEGARILNKNNDLNENSAKDYINNLRHMLNGEVFKRTLSADSFEYYLKKIKADFGLEPFKKSINSLKLHNSYYEETRKKESKRKKVRDIIEFYENELSKPDSFENLTTEFNIQVNKSIADNQRSRQERLSTSPKYPEKKSLQIEFFIRNPDVVAEVLLRANGKCERCCSDAPFLRKKDNTPYLEVHHKTPLSEGGADTVDNAIALCPNCHRYLHYGENM
ncbi:HNH endonuclease [Dickeya dadantii]|uniref:HNH endonuclease n=1 Tax=Dickeya dadantii TaxID=204038 RepID=UPI0021D98D86|nr:HNH endonuclease signature motif containing protein [Dickeya dadantii]